MVQKQHYQAYAAATQTVAKTQQIVMLYDGLIRFLQHGKEAMRERRIEERYHLLTKATDVLIGLQSCLDFEKGGDMAKLLYGFYSSMYNRITSLHRGNSIEECEAIITELKTMRDVWYEIDQGLAKGADAPEKPGSAMEAAQQGNPPASDQPITLSA